MKTTKAVLNLALFLVAGLTNVYATGQAPDKLIYGGKERDLFANPLEELYRGSDSKRPRFMIGPGVVSTGNWRGYVATWEIDQSKLFLSKIDSWICSSLAKSSCKQVNLADLFPSKVNGDKVGADWFSGQLRIPDGKELQYVHMGYGSVYERDILIEVTKGIVGKVTIKDNTKAQIPSSNAIALEELKKLKDSPYGNEPMFPAATRKDEKSAPSNSTSSESVTVTPGKGVFSVGTKRSDLEAVIGKGEPGSRYDDVYFVDYPKAGVQASFENKTDRVHVIFLYNRQPRYENYAVPTVVTDKGISWNATDDDVLKAYGKPLKDFSDESKSWRRLEYPGIDFLFQGGKLGRIGILGPDGN